MEEISNVKIEFVCHLEGEDALSGSAFDKFAQQSAQKLAEVVDSMIKGHLPKWQVAVGEVLKTLRVPGRIASWILHTVGASAEVVSDGDASSGSYSVFVIVNGKKVGRVTVSAKFVGDEDAIVTTGMTRKMKRNLKKNSVNIRPA